MGRGTPTKPKRRRSLIRFGACCIASSFLTWLSGCLPAQGVYAGADTLTIGAYSVVRDALREKILPGFAAHWKAKTGRRVRFEESYNASGAQSRAIASGFDADVAILSLEGDVERLVKAGLVEPNWKDGPHQGLVTRSLVVIGVRPGNPLKLQGWEDLERPGIGVLYPDPKTSGGAKWNINAIYGSAMLEDREHPNLQAGFERLAKVQANVLNMDSSGRQSMATFERGTGDAVVTYENELLLQQKRKGVATPYVIPDSTLQIEGPVAIVESSVRQHGNREVAEAFLDYLRQDEAQRIFAEYGFRALDSRLDPPDRMPLPQKLFTIAELGGWKEINQKVYGPGGLWDALFTGKKGGKP